MRFDEKIVVVTGGGQGIGAASAARFLDEGARVAVIDLDCAPFMQSLPVHVHDRVVCVDADCTDAQAVQRFFDQVDAQWGRVDVLFNNVGQSARAQASLFCQSREEVWRFVLETSLITAMRATRRVAPGMQAGKWGRIVNMSSNAALDGQPGLADYAAAKMGIVGLTRSVAQELAPWGVTVNAVCPGAIRTRAHDALHPDVLARVLASIPMGFVGEPRDVAAAVAFLASEEARFITGQTLVIDGGKWMV